MTPLGAVALGLLCAIGDVTVSGLDLLPDPVGWWLVMVGIGRLGSVNPLLVGARRAAVVTALLAAADLVAALAGGELPALLDTVFGAAQLVTVLLLCLGLRERARAWGDDVQGTRFARLAVVLGVLGTSTLILSELLAVVDEVEDVVVPGLVLLGLGLVELGVVAWVTVVTMLVRRLPWAQRSAATAAPPAAAGPSIS